MINLFWLHFHHVHTHTHARRLTVLICVPCGFTVCVRMFHLSRRCCSHNAIKIMIKRRKRHSPKAPNVVCAVVKREIYETMLRTRKTYRGPSKCFRWICWQAVATDQQSHPWRCGQGACIYEFSIEHLDTLERRWPMNKIFVCLFLLFVPKWIDRNQHVLSRAQFMAQFLWPLSSALHDRHRHLNRKWMCLPMEPTSTKFDTFILLNSRLRLWFRETIYGQHFNEYNNQAFITESSSASNYCHSRKMDQKQY